MIDINEQGIGYTNFEKISENQFDFIKYLIKTKIDFIILCDTNFRTLLKSSKKTLFRRTISLSLCFCNYLQVWISDQHWLSGFFSIIDRSKLLTPSINLITKSGAGPHFSSALLVRATGSQAKGHKKNPSGFSSNSKHGGILTPRPNFCTRFLQEDV